MNAPDRFELFVLPPDTEKLTVTQDTKVPNAAVFKIYLEDHTLGNIIRCQLLKDPTVIFAGYQQPHPLENYILVRIQTAPQNNPVAAFQHCLAELQKEFASIYSQFETQLAPHGWRTADERREM
ncbi:putative RNA polymerase II core subunit [Paratrimastix pyriformis]|uniref:RNA polymerase II core subunit n=1 Tax=Paratrimastix pyriformis TaxID=342808 RepID=A0ABQ8UW79_9EUKA|nr:putative RNA polymerase II core subunit [Paratrimastix pyriformis]